MQQAVGGRWPGALVLALAGGLALLAPRPQLDNRPEVWFPSSDPRLATYAEFKARFGGDEALVLVVEGGDPLGGLRLAADLTDALAEDPTVVGLTSARTAFPGEVEVLLEPELGGLDNLRFVGVAFEGPLNRTLHLWEREPARSTLMVTLRPGPPAERAALVQRLQPFARRAEEEGRALRLAGHPLINIALDQAAREVDSRAMPLLIAVCVGVLLLTTRSLRLALALLAPVGLGVLACDGLLGLLAVDSNLIVGIVKPLVFVLLLAAGFHVVVAFVDERRRGQAPAQAAARAAELKRWPTLLALLTTAIGFGSLVLSPVAPIRTFGWLAAAAMGLGAPLILLSLPLLLRALGSGPDRGSPPAVGRAVQAVVRLGWSRPALWLSACLLLTALGGVGLSHLQPQPHAIEYFRPDHPLRRDHDAMARLGAPLASLEALVELPAPAGSDAVLLEALDRFSQAAGRAPGVLGAVGLPLVLREAVHRTARRDALPDPILTAEILEREGERLTPFLQEGGRLARLSLPCAELDPEDYDQAEGAIRAAFQEAFAGVRGARLELTGSYGLLLGTQRALLSTLHSSLISTALLMQVVLALSLRSLRMGLAAIPPNVVPVAAIFTWMWAAGVPLDVGTSMTAAIALGIAVDGTLHFLHAWSRHALEETARSTGRAVLLTALVVGLGFLSLLSSDFGPTRHFGELCAVAMLAALLGDLLVLPATLRLLFPRGGQGRGAPDQARAEAEPSR